MARKYEVVEVDGIFGLIMHGSDAAPTEGLHAHPVYYNEGSGQIHSMKQSGWCNGGRYFVTKGHITFDSNGRYETTGVTHHMGHKMTLDQLSAESGSTFAQLSDKFSSKYSEDMSNYHGKVMTRFERIFETVLNGSKKLNEHMDRRQAKDIEELDTMIPGFKAGYEHAAYKAKVFAEKLEDNFIDRYIENDKGQQTPPQSEKKNLNYIISNADAKRHQTISAQTRSAEKMPNIPQVPNGASRGR